MDYPNVLHVLLLLICFLITISGVPTTKKVFFCRDPDTGNLYPTNTTWPSTTFCGRYTCKLRKKTSNDELPTQIINQMKSNQDSTKNDTGFTIEARRDSGLESVIHKTKDHNETKEGDRFLTNEEIATLSVLLQSMKKSDLEAILELYNIAQDIYKEIDKLNGDSFQENGARKPFSENRKEKNVNYVPNGKKSYWYEPAIVANTKVKFLEPLLLSPMQPELKFAKTKVINHVYEAGDTGHILSNLKFLDFPPTHTKLKDKPYFLNPFAKEEMSKMPYFHSISEFQKKASYVHPSARLQHEKIGKSPEVPMSPLHVSSNSGLKGSNMLPSYNQKYSVPIQQLQVQRQEQSQPLANLQSLAHVSAEAHASNPNFSNQKLKCCKKKRDESVNFLPWAKMIKKPHMFNEYDHRPMLKFESGNYNPNMKTNLQFINELNLASLINSLLVKKSKEETALKKGEFTPQTVFSPGLKQREEKSGDKKIKTENIEASSGCHTARSLNFPNNVNKAKFIPYPLQNKIKLEKVASVSIVDEKKRLKRKTIQNTEINPDYEAYLEVSKCQTDTEPGFFRMGNASHPYPECCPQRIRS